MSSSTGGARVRWDWRYSNRTGERVDLWVALPPDLPCQPGPRIVRSSPPGFPGEPTLAGGPNRVAFVSLPPGELARLTVEVVLPDEPAGLAGPSPAPDPSAYLGSSALIQVNDEVRAEARAAVGEAASCVERARRLFRHLLNTCRYVWPPSERGSESMRKNRLGDCGEYSFLYAALCRSIDLPCRVLIGTLLGRRMRPHVWNEVYLDGTGWIGVDVRVDEIVLKRLAGRGARWAARRLEHRFGRPRSDRLAFSVDPCVLLHPPFEERPAPEGARDLVVAGRQFAWGFETLEGAAPYLQPCYIRFHGNRAPARPSDYVGHWRLRRL